MKLEKQFDATQSYVLVAPVGWYAACVTGAEARTSRTGNQGLEVKFSLLEGQFAGMSCKKWLNYFHEKPITRAIAEEELASICRACGIAKLEDTDDLLNSVLRIKLTLDEYDGKKINKVSGYGAMSPEHVAPKATRVAAPASTATWG